MFRTAVESALLRAGVQAVTAEEAARLVGRDPVGIVLYGSYARGDAGPGSDVDLLVLADRPAGSRSSATGSVSVSTYTPAQLSSARGTLFGMHLGRDGIVIADVDGILRTLLALMGEPDPLELFARIRHLSALLEDQPADAHLRGRVRVARYLLRTAIYGEALASGEPCFSVKELAARAGDPDLEYILTSRPQPEEPSLIATLAELRDRLLRVIGAVSSNPYGSLQNLVVTEWLEDTSRASLGAIALANDASAFDYSALQKVLL